MTLNITTQIERSTPFMQFRTCQFQGVASPGYVVRFENKGNANPHGYKNNGLYNVKEYDKE